MKKTKIRFDYNIHTRQWIFGFEFGFGYAYSFYVNFGPFSVGFFKIKEDKENER